MGLWNLFFATEARHPKLGLRVGSPLQGLSQNYDIFLAGQRERTYPISDLSSCLKDRCLYGAALGVPRQLSEVDFERRTAVSVMTEFQRLAGDTLRVQGWPCLERLPQGSQRQVRGLHYQRDPASNQVILSRYFSEHPPFPASCSRFSACGWTAESLSSKSDSA